MCCCKWRPPIALSKCSVGSGASGEDSDVAEELATRLTAGNVDGLAELLLPTNDTDALARGLRIPDDVDAKRSANQSMEGDVIARKAIAMVMLAFRGEEEAEKLAKVIVKSTSPGSSNGAGCPQMRNLETCCNFGIDGFSVARHATRYHC